jgi:2-keto-4-pentenoate hydratase/2-oxohepta-3-ene-1,7-dioic acid hydratase in catechol pathway
MVPANEVELPSLRVITRVDGQVKQDAPLTDLIFPVDVIIAFVTAFMTLEPGDLIATGTPPGVGPMLPGQTVEVEIPGIGLLRNPIVQG